jgi:hypothetical protein
MTVASNAARPRRADSIFFPAMAWAIAAGVFVGFSPSWFLRFYFHSRLPLNPLLAVHAMVATLWIVVFVTQVSLVAANRRDIHRKLGWWAAGLAAIMVIMGWMAAVWALRAGMPPSHRVPSEVFFASPVRDGVVFAPLVLLGVLNRKRPDFHKRYLLISSISLLDPALGRLTQGSQFVPLVLTDLLLLPLVAYDIYQHGKVYRATLIGSAIVVGCQVAFVLIAPTPWWQAFAHLFA